jgi:hypothetical protein
VKFHWFAAFYAKFGPIRIFGLAFWAFHFGSPPGLKKGQFERKNDGYLAFDRVE